MSIQISAQVRKDRNTVEPGWSLNGFTLVTEDQFDQGSLNNSLWTAYNNSTFGSNQRIQTYMSSNVIVGTGSAGATNGKSLKLRTIETDAGSGTLPTAGALPGSAGTRYSYTAGMVDSQSSGKYYNRYGRFEWRVKSPHGQGLWPALWLTANNGGATTCEMDIFEYFHSQIPGKNSSTIHGTDNTGTFHANRYTNNGAAGNGTGGRTFFEAPTYTPGWHVWTAEIVPVTDATGTVAADPNQPSSYVRLTVYLDGAVVWQVVDTSATWWTTHGGASAGADPTQFWNVYVQGCQVDGTFVGHPRSPLGYSHQSDSCLISGTAPNSCTVTTGGYTVQQAQFGDPASTLEIDYFRFWRFTG